MAARSGGQTVSGGVDGCLSAVSGASLVEDAGHVLGYGAVTDEQLPGYQAVALASGDKAQHLHLSLAQAIGIGLSLTPGLSQSFTVHVPGSQPTIQAGLNVAASGDTVLVAPGTYTGPNNRQLDFLGKSIVLRSSGGAAATIIDCQGAARGFRFHSDETPSANAWHRRRIVYNDPIGTSFNHQGIS